MNGVWKTSFPLWKKDKEKTCNPFTIFQNTVTVCISIQNHIFWFLYNLQHQTTWYKSHLLYLCLLHIRADVSAIQFTDISNHVDKSHGLWLETCMTGIIMIYQCSWTFFLNFLEALDKTWVGFKRKNQGEKIWYASPEFQIKDLKSGIGTRFDQGRVQVESPNLA